MAVHHSPRKAYGRHPNTHATHARVPFAPAPTTRPASTTSRPLSNDKATIPRRELVADTPTRTDRRARSPSNDQLAAGIDSEDEPEPDTDNGSDTSASPPGPARTRAFADYHFPARAAPQPPSGPRAVADFKDYLRAVQSFSTLVAGIRLPNAPSLGDILSLDLRLAGALRRTSELETASIGRDRAICALESLVDLLREAGWDAAGRRDIEP